jgi:hypothetical protein
MFVTQFAKLRDAAIGAVCRDAGEQTAGGLWVEQQRVAGIAGERFAFMHRATQA